MANPVAYSAKFVKSVVEEGSKVIWPDRPTVIRHTIMVIISVGIAMAIFASLDYGLQQLVLVVLNGK
ncbi:MAG TPA: preprotein translocase subunit SecE [Candidatus Saccharimonadales bacterium]|nr:preprotein translocase subunit SecE [Candidatus Saccharimonadales bacterium]